MENGKSGDQRPRVGRVEGGPRPPTDASVRWAAVEYARVGEPWSGYLLGDRMVAVVTHWDNGRSVLCQADTGCPHCSVDSKPRVCYYVAAWGEAAEGDAILLLPASAASKVLGLAEDQGTMRGLRVKVHKCGRGPRGWYDVELLGRAAHGTALRKAFDLRPQLCRLFRVPRLPEYLYEEGGVE